MRNQLWIYEEQVSGEEISEKYLDCYSVLWYVKRSRENPKISKKSVTLERFVHHIRR